MVNESETDVFIMGLLNDANISFTYKGAKTKPVKDALKTASKSGKKQPGYPEFVCENEDFLIIIEDKAELNKQALYLDENSNELDMSTDAIQKYAENGALHYANRIIENIPSIKKVFAFGCSGDKTHHIIRPIFVDENGYKLLNEVENFENFNSENINDYYREIVLGLPSHKEIELNTLLKKSAELNEHLRNYGQLGDTQKPLIVSAILLALNEKPNITDDLNGDNVEPDGKKIYKAVETQLDRVNVGKKKSVILNQFTLLKDYPKINEINEDLGETPLKYFTEFIKDEIFPSISYTETDILGYFYSEFIKYSGIDGSSLGIVLTPKHVTELFCELLDIKPTDKILDPCCGTGSFLISALTQMVEQANTEEEIKNIKLNNLHGIELRPHLFAIGATNMILRGDGKSNLKLADFFDLDADDLRKENYTVGLMNPPYSQGGKLSEINFIKHLLDSLANNGRCAVIVPQPVMMGGTNKDDKKIKKDLLKKHTLEGVISLNNDTIFYRKNVHPCIAIFTAHVPHPPEKRCKFINFVDDGYKVNKHVGIVKTERAIERKKHLIECWLYNKPAESKFMVETKIKPNDEWVHGFYYFNDDIPLENDFEEIISSYLSFELDMVMKNKEFLFEEDD